MRGHAIKANQAAEIRLALGHNPDSERYEALARKHGLAVSTLRKMHWAGRK
jgi:hypothetical protein